MRAVTRKFLTTGLTFLLSKHCRTNSSYVKFAGASKMNFNAQYYDCPEGQDAFGKMVAINKYAAGIGLGWGTIDVLMISKPQGYLPTLGRYAYWVGPLMGMASAFTMGTFLMTNLRKKDDRINYIFGGFCAGGVLGSWKRSLALGLVGGTFLAIAAAVKKTSKIEGWEFFPPLKTRELGSLRGVRHDWTLLADPPKGWTTGKEQ